MSLAKEIKLSKEELRANKERAEELVKLQGEYREKYGVISHVNDGYIDSNGNKLKELPKDYDKVSVINNSSELKESNFLPMKSKMSIYKELNEELRLEKKRSQETEKETTFESIGDVENIMRRALDYAIDKGNMELASVLEKEMVNFERQRVVLTIDLMDEEALQAQLNLFNTDYEGLVDIYIERLQVENHRSDLVKDIVVKANEVNDEKPVMTKKQCWSVSGVETVEDFVRKSISNSDGHRKFMEKGKFVKSKYYRYVADMMECTPDNVRMTIKRKVKEGFDYWTSIPEKLKLIKYVA